LSLAIDFDCYLIDEVIRRRPALPAPLARRIVRKAADRSLILASHMGEFIKPIVHVRWSAHGRGNLFSDIDLALQVYNDL
jgi:hypothetical protein